MSSEGGSDGEAQLLGLPQGGSAVADEPAEQGRTTAPEGSPKAIVLGIYDDLRRCGSDKTAIVRC